MYRLQIHSMEISAEWFVDVDTAWKEKALSCMTKGQSSAWVSFSLQLTALANSVSEGPQFSTRAESNMYRSWGGTVINMSVLPEAKLAAEAEIAYQMVVMSTDYDCWHDSGDVTVEMVMGHMKANAINARRFIGAVLDELSKEEHEDLVSAKHLAGGRKFGVSTHTEGRSKAALEKMQWLFPGYFV